MGSSIPRRHDAGYKHVDLHGIQSELQEVAKAQLCFRRTYIALVCLAYALAG